MKHVEFLNLIRVVSLRIVLSFFFIFLAVVTLTPQVHAASNNSKTLETAQTTPKSDKYSLETTGREVSTSKYGAWMVTCSIEAQSDTEECSAIYEIVDKQKGITLMSWLVGFSKKQMLMSEIVTPTGVLIPPGVGLTVDQEKLITIPYAACAPRGCKSRFELTRKLRAKLAKASSVVVSVTALDGRSLNFSLDFNGFRKALADLLI